MSSLSKSRDDYLLSTGNRSCVLGLSRRGRLVPHYGSCGHVRRELAERATKFSSDLTSFPNTRARARTLVSLYRDFLATAHTVKDYANALNSGGEFKFENMDFVVKMATARSSCEAS